MAKKFDVIIEAVRYDANGKIELVRGYERRGFTYSDHILLKRMDLVERLKKGGRVVTGERKEFMASTFDIRKDVRYDLQKDVLTSSDAGGEKLDVPNF